jgi:hypothetical protein
MASEALSPSSSWTARYDAVPFTRIESNEWYGIADSSQAAKQRDAAKVEFIASGDLEAPRLEYPRLRELDFSATERSLQSLLAEAATLPGEDSDLAYERAARKLAELYRHKEIARSLGLLARKQLLSRERASIMSQELFGVPEAGAFDQIIANLRSQAERLKEATPVADEMLHLLGSPEAVDLPRGLELTDQTIETLRGDLTELYPGLDAWAAGDPDESMNVADSVRYIEDLLEITGLKKQGWTINLLDSDAAASTHKKQKVITVGSLKLLKMNRGQLIKTGIHESLGHASRQPIGLDNLAFEEGIGVALEQIISRQKRIPGEQYFTSLGLQLGLDRDGNKRSFREVYEILWRRIILDDVEKERTVDIQEAKHKAYKQCMRTTRGGALDARDISYSAGAAIAHPWLNSLVELAPVERKRILHDVLSKSYDPTNEIHRAKAETL